MQAGVTRYTYDYNNQILTIVDARGNNYLTNQYDANGRVMQQTMADGGIWQYAYTADVNGNLTQTDITNPRGFIERLTFNTTGYFSGGQVLSDTRAFGRPEQQTITYNRDSSGLLTSIVDALNRTTQYSYDSRGNLQTVIRAFGTSDAATIS